MSESALGAACSVSMSEYSECRSARKVSVSSATRYQPSFFLQPIPGPTITQMTLIMRPMKMKIMVENRIMFRTSEQLWLPMVPMTSALRLG